ncbi:hypothetical protein PGTUg99_007458 [Puccinia graminis f. sp. tritici]|uniref:Uncharacterized protein n=1 Tax=Puccinia graminis f. sp. tritici TaxID=56615 RepID=A0A5B0RJQ9_PUCGR|nr:hypothetical protein PGTUg99_007458 [Puccinia graminis f. sp. tritici]
MSKGWDSASLYILLRTPSLELSGSLSTQLTLPNLQLWSSSPGWQLVEDDPDGFWTLLAIADLLVIMCSLFEHGNHLNAAPVVLGGARQNIDLCAGIGGHHSTYSLLNPPHGSLLHPSPCNPFETRSSPS